MTSNHTTLPWEVAEYGDGKIMIINKESMRGVVCFSYIDDEARANAAFIVKAVNCHDDLVKVVKIMRKSIDDEIREDPHEPSDGVKRWCQIVDTVLEKVNS